MEMILREAGLTRVVAQVQDKYKSKNEKVFDIRIQYQPEGQEVWYPTRKGIALSVNELQEIFDNMDNILTEMEK